jgi:hypothetical protein
MIQSLKLNGLQKEIDAYRLINRSMNGSRLQGGRQGKRDNTGQATKQGGQAGLMLIEVLQGARRGNKGDAATWCWTADSRFIKM